MNGANGGTGEIGHFCVSPSELEQCSCGGLSPAGDVLINKFEYYYHKYAFHAFCDTEFVLAELGNGAGIYGCVKMLL